MTGPGSTPVSDGDRLRAALESTALGPAVPSGAVDDLCTHAVGEGLRAVCVPPAWVARAAAAVEGSDVRVVTVAGFPFGDAPPPVLAAQARTAREAGAHEVDVVFPLHCVLSGDWTRAGAALDAFEDGLDGLPHKVILETAAWDEGTLERLLAYVRSRGTPTVKTSTGYHPAGGATVEVVRTLRDRLPSGVRIKAAGGIRDRGSALALLDAGADFLGTSSAARILDG